MSNNFKSYKFPDFGKLQSRKKIFLAVIGVYLLSHFIPIFPSSVTVGDYAGECSGYCNNTYEISNNAIHVNQLSTEDKLPDIHQTINGEFSELKFQVPLRLLFCIGHTFGHPDDRDQGGYTLGFRFFGMSFSYNIDKGYEPWYFSDMTDVIKDRMRRINAITTKSNKNP